MMRLSVALSLAIAIGIIALTAVVGATASVAAGVLAGTLAAAGSAVFLWRRPVVALDPAAASRGLKVVSLLAAALALFQLTRLAVFIVDPSRTEASTVPWSRWEIGHSCATAYYVAGKAVPDVPNVYDDALYSLPGDPSAPRKPRLLDGFPVDVYEYPPPFLLLPRALFLVAPDFLRFRMIWFSFNLAVVLAVMLAVARRFGPDVGTRVLLLSSLVWASLPLVNAFQKENVQMMIVALSVLAMLLFEKGRWASGGFVLAFAIASKLYPGMLIPYLLVRRKWRAVAWTAAFGAAIFLVSLLDTGWTPYSAFLRHLPALLSGEAFPAFRNPMASAINFSVPGLVFKLKLFGVPGVGYGVARVLGSASTLAALALIVRAARGPEERDDPRTWLAVVLLATLCSPFLPQAYAGFPPLWLLTLLAAPAALGSRALAWTLLGWVVLCVLVPVDTSLDARLVALFVLPPQALTVGLAVAGVSGASTNPSQRASLPPAS